MGLDTQENQLAVIEIKKQGGAIPACGSDALRLSLSAYNTEVSNVLSFFFHGIAYIGAYYRITPHIWRAFYQI